MSTWQSIQSVIMFKYQLLFFVPGMIGSILVEFFLSPKLAIADTANLIVQNTPVFQLLDVQPSDQSFLALQSLVERYHCIAGDLDAQYRDYALTRNEFAARLMTCLEHLTDTAVAPADHAILQKLQAEFTSELQTIQSRVNRLAAQNDRLASEQFSSTTKLSGEAIFAASGAFGNPSNSQRQMEDNLILSDRVRLTLNTSFSGQDLLRIRLQASNTPNLGNSTGTNMARLSFDGDTGNQLTLNQLYYKFPIGSAGAVTAIAKGTLFDVVDPINPLLGSDSTGSISAFGVRSPIYREEAGGTGISISYSFNPAINLAVVYLATDANRPTTGTGLFGGSYSALAQLTIKPTKSLTLGLTYARSRNAIAIGTSSPITNDPFNRASHNIIGNSYSIAAS